MTNVKRFGQILVGENSAVMLLEINGNESLDILDIILMIKMILDDEYNVVTDVNQDGSVDILDVIVMANILVEGLLQTHLFLFESTDINLESLFYRGFFVL